MEVRILKDGNKVAFQGKVSYLDELKQVMSYIRNKDNEFGMSFTYEIPNLRELIEKELLNMEKRRIQKILDSYGYNSLGDLQVYASQNDQEAKAILSWYTNSNGNGYDDLIWNWIENELPKYQTVDELLSVDLRQVEEEIFNQSVQNNPLP